MLDNEDPMGCAVIFSFILIEWLGETNIILKAILERSVEGQASLSDARYLWNIIRDQFDAWITIQSRSTKSNSDFVLYSGQSYPSRMACRFQETFDHSTVPVDCYSGKSFSR